MEAMRIVVYVVGLTQPELQECFDAGLATMLHDPLGLVHDAHQETGLAVLVNKGLIAE